MRFEMSAAGLKPFRALCAALALPAAIGLAAPAAAEPTFAQTETINAQPGVTLTIRLDELFDNAGTNPVFIGVGYPATEHLDSSGTALDDDTRDSFTVTVKSASALNALPSPPPSPFTFEAYVGMRNDEGQDASGTVTFQTTYARTDPTMPPEPSGPAAEPTFAQTETINAPPGVTLTLHVEDLFDNAGTNPVFIGVGYPATDHLDSSGTALDDDTRDRFTVTVKSAAALNALPSPPPSPFTFEAEVGMRNDEGQDASGTITFRTTYARTDPSPPSPPGEAPASIEGADEGG